MRPIHRQSSEISAEMNTSPRTYLPSLPSDFHLSPSHHDCHYPTPSRSPTLFSPTLHSSVNSPLASYATTRQRYRILVQPEDTEQLQRAQVSLSALSPTNAQLGAVGGHFKSTTKIKCVPLPALYIPQQVGRRGIRAVRLHTDRYFPSKRSNHTVSDSLLNLPTLENRPKARLAGQEVKLQRARLYKSASGVLPHRMEQPFYMSGHKAHIVGRQDLPHSDLEEMENVRFAENPTLYYGRGIAPGPQGSRAVQRFELRLKTALESRNSGMRGNMDVYHDDTPTIMEDPKEISTHSKRQTFITEYRTG